MSHSLAIMDNLGGPELVFIMVLALLLFGSKRMPELGRSVGRAMREFKKATSEMEENLREVMLDEPRTPKIRPPTRLGLSRGGTANGAPTPAVEPRPPFDLRAHTTPALQSPPTETSIAPTPPPQTDESGAPKAF